MSDSIEDAIELLETAYSTNNWELVLDTILLLNEIPDGIPPDEEDEKIDNHISD